MNQNLQYASYLPAYIKSTVYFLHTYLVPLKDLDNLNC